jgi:histidinol-phosphate aminotransferase
MHGHRRIVPQDVRRYAACVTTPRMRSDLGTLPAYRAGKRPEPRDDLVVYKVSSNENPYPPLPSVLEAIARAAADVHRYPDPFSQRLISALAKRFDVPEDHIALGTGSVAICGQIITAATHPGDEVMYAWRSFESYPIWTQIGHATSVQVPLRADESHDLDAMANAITDRTRVIFVCSPNNPTGQVVKRAELTAFLDRVPNDVLVVLDEAYREFITDPDVPDGVEEYRQRPNVIVLRTFSKAYGLAALRVGFAIAHTSVAQALRQMALPFGVSTIAEEAAIASLAAEDELIARVRSLATERERVWQVLVDQGWELSPTQANFIWLRLGADSESFAQACNEAGITVRVFPGEGVRVTIAEEEANQRFIEVARRFQSEHAGSDSHR